MTKTNFLSAVWGDQAFYGRREEFNRILNILTSNRRTSIIIQGDRGIGKTSLLHKIVRHLETLGTTPIYTNWVGVSSFNTFINEIVFHIATILGDDINQGELRDITSLDEFIAWIKQHEYFHNKNMLLLCFDDFDQIGNQLYYDAHEYTKIIRTFAYEGKKA